MKTSKSKMIQTVISLLIMFVAGYFIPTWGPVTRMGVQYLCIMIGWIYMSIVTGGLLLSSVIALTACVIPGYYTAASIVSTTLGNSITLLMIFIFIMVYIFQKTQTGEFLVRWLLSRKVVNGRPYLFTAFFFIAIILIGAVIATIGINGVGTMLIKQLTGYVVNPNWLSSLPGLITIYCYFQIPLMIIIFLPAVDSIRPQWREATESLGGNTFQYWTRVAGPILAPRFISAFLLLFASAFSAYATAAALFSQRSILVPLMIQGAMRNEMDPNQQGFAQVLAFAMIVVVAVVMMISHAVEKRAGRWQ